MCGIVGAVAQRDVQQILLEGLKRLEYRGYDSAGIAILNNGSICRRRTKGKVSKLKALCDQKPLPGSIGVAHTRWATHGVPSEKNAHPHMSGNDIAIVHNGIIENHVALRKTLKKQGYQFQSETDTETIAHFIDSFLKQGCDFLTSIKNTVKQLKGAFALGVIHTSQPDHLYAIRCGSPLVVGVGIGENFIASDHYALLPVTQQFIYLEEGDIASISRSEIKIFDTADHEVEREIKQSNVVYKANQRGQYRHFMQKEIYEQPQAIQTTIEGRINPERVLDELLGETAISAFNQTKRVQIIACGTSYHAGLVAKHWLESIAGIPCQVEIASEFRYRNHIVDPHTLFITISQSGETADTLAALRDAQKENYSAYMTIGNTPESSLVRESDFTMMTYAGVEIGVASTKAFTTQLVSLFMLTLALGRRNKLSKQKEATYIESLLNLSNQAESILTLDEAIKSLSQSFIDKEHSLFLGRGLQYPIALEGALKLKEISYIHAEAYPAGELKHGPLALVDKEMPVIAIAPNDALLEKLKSNLAEVRARGGKLIVFAESDYERDPNTQIITMPKIDPILAPVLYTIPLQLLAYHVALIKGTDVDQPRNLAKSVTVE